MIVKFAITIHVVSENTTKNKITRPKETPNAKVAFEEKVTNKAGTEPKPKEAMALPDKPTEAPKYELMKYKTNSSIKISSDMKGGSETH